jgi:hypothetical protein
MSADRGEVRFSADEVYRHAGTVDAVADSVRLARSAVHEVTMDSQAYGQLCQFLPGLLSPLFGLAAAALNRSAGSLQVTAAKLRSTAGELSGTDAAAAGRIESAGRALPELPL